MGSWFLRAAPLTAAIAGVLTAQDFEAVERSGRLALRIRATEVGNLTWQVDTLAGRTQTRPKDYQDLWKAQLGWTEADTRQLDRWKALAEEYRRQPPGQKPAQPRYPANYGRYYASSIGPDYQFRIAGLTETNRTLGPRYRKLCGSACADGFVPVLEHFRPRFLRWWKSEGGPTARRFLGDTRKEAARHGMVKFFDSVARLTEAELGPNHEILLHLVVHPKDYLTNMTGTVMDNHMLVEVADDEEVGGVRLGTVIHELTHHFYDFAPAGKHMRLIDRFAARPEPYTLAAYSILNEALACAVQIRWEKQVRPAAEFEAYLAKDDNIYQDPFISKAGRALAPVIERRLAGGLTIHDDTFVGEYLEAFARVLGPALLASPRLRLSSRVTIHGPEGKAAQRLFGELVRGINTQDEWQDLRETPDLGGLVLLTRADVAPVLEKHSGVLTEDALQAIREAMRSQPDEAFVYAMPRSARASLYVLYAPEAQGLEQLTRRFAASDEPFTGFRKF